MSVIGCKTTVWDTKNKLKYLFPLVKSPHCSAPKILSLSNLQIKTAKLTALTMFLTSVCFDWSHFTD